jgi:3-hydroxy acid dehydrogenase/malonic semialdehyde reductase
MAAGSGKTAMITGAGSGIGAAVAAALSEAGTRVVLAGRRQDKLEVVAGGLGGEFVVLPLDVTDAAVVTALPDALPAGWREIDILINNAGHDLGGRSSYVGRDIGDVAATIETNVVGLMRVTHALLPGMLERVGGDIVNISSVNATESSANHAVYVASKHAVHGFSDSMRAELRGSGIRVAEIMPGTVRTEFAEARWRGDRERAEAFYAGYDSVLTPTDIAAAVVYVLSQPRHVNISQMVLRPS